MLLVKNDNLEPARNIAIDEYLLTGFDDEVVRLWRNDSAVIIGRNQNAIEEMDLDFVKAHNIQVIRRLSGGGAVFHDLGNICFTFVEQYREGDFNNYAKFTAPIRDYLRTLGVDARLSGRNDLTVEGKKISGNAQTVKNGRIMHHGTLLFSLDFTRLVGALRPKDIKIESKGVKSVRSRVTNIASHLEAPMTVEEFLSGLEGYLLEHMEGLRPYAFTGADERAVDRLVSERYAVWDWNFGASPACNVRHARRFDCGVVEAALDVQKGRVAGLTIYGDFFGIQDKAGLEERFRGLRYEREELLAAARDCGLERYIAGLAPEDFVNLLMGDKED